MFRQSSFIVATVLIAGPTCAMAQGITPRAFLRPTADAGTGPYIGVLQAGLTGFVEGPVEVFTGLANVRQELVSLETEGPFDETRAAELIRQVEVLKYDINQLGQDRSESWLHETDVAPLSSKGRNGLISAISAITKATNKPQLVQAVDNAVSTLDKLVIDYRVWVRSNALNLLRRYLDESAKAELGALKMGSFFRDDSTAAFGTLTYSLGEQIEHDRTNLRTAAFLTGSMLIPIDSGTAPTSRLGMGYLFGDPDRLVSGLSVAAFISPGAVDTEASVNLKVGASTPEEDKPEPARNSDAWPAWMKRQEWIANREPHLLDHVRPGDWWLGGNVRYISGAGSSSNLNTNRFPTGTALSATLTYALSQRSYENDKNQSPIAATTLGLTGTYCAQHALGVDELGVEVRTPIAGLGLHAWPIYFSVRYGTRSDFTVALETRF